MNLRPVLAVLTLAAGSVLAGPQVAALSVTNPSVSAATTSPMPVAAQAVPDERLEALGAGDMVHITVFRNPDLTTDTRVSDRGTVLFPMIGEVSLAGLTSAQAAQAIAAKLRGGGFVVNPEVTVAATQVNSRQVAVLGNVVKPGRYPLDSLNVHLTDFLATAAGIAPTGSDRVTIISIRDGRQQKMEVDLSDMFRSGDMARNVSLEPGDTIYVERAPMVYVYGEVQKGGAYRVEPDMTVMQAIALASGITPRGTDRGIKLTRRDGTRTRQLDARLTYRVQPDDVIQVQESLF